MLVDKTQKLIIDYFNKKVLTMCPTLISDLHGMRYYNYIFSIFLVTIIVWMSRLEKYERVQTNVNGIICLPDAGE